jgi:tetratricopeptide (TPR) repeat protein
MTVEVYLGKKFEHSHERRALARFLKDMLAGFGESEKLYQIVVETKVNSADIDLLLISPSALIIVEFKAFVHAEESEAQHIHLVGKLNDSWKYVLPNGRDYTVGDPAMQKNPYRQTREMRYELANWLAANSQVILGQVWKKEDALEHTFAWVVAWPGFDGGLSDLALPPDELDFHRTPYKWFQVVPIDRLASEFDCAPDTRLRLTEEQQRNLIKQLGVFACSNVQELVPGYATPALLFSKPPELETLIDRDPQRVKLLSTLDAPGKSIIVIEGLAGVGRTAVAAWLVAEATRRGYRTRWIDCRDRSNLTLDALLAAISTEVTDLTRSLIRNPDEPLGDRLDAALHFLNARPTLLVLDDYHLLANRSSIDQFIARATRHHECLRILTTSRERFAEASWPPGAVCEVEMSNLSREAFAEFVSVPTHHVDLKPEDTDIVWQRLSGNPQAFLLSRSTIRRLSLTGGLNELPITDSEQRAKSLLDNVSADAQALAQRLSILRTRFRFQTIQALAQIPPDRASELTLELVDKYWLQLQTAGEFVMLEIIRTALYGRMTDKVKKEHHQKAGEHFGTLADATAEPQRIEYLLEALYHFQQGGPRKQLLKRSTETIELLLKAGDREQARAIAEIALITAREEQDPEKICFWLLTMSRLELGQERRAQAEELLGEAAAHLPDPARKLSKEQKTVWQRIEAQIYHLRGRAAYQLRDYQLATEHFQRSRSLAQGCGDDATAAGCLTSLASIARRHGDLEAAVILGNQAMEIARRISDQKLLCDNLGHLGLAERLRGRYEDAKWLFARAYEIALTTNNIPVAEILLGHLGRTIMLSGDNEEAERIFRRALKLAQDLRGSIGIRVQMANLAEVLIREGRYAEAEFFVNESEPLNQAAKDTIGLAWNLKHRGQIAKARGQIAYGNNLIRQGLAYLNNMNDTEYLAEFESALHQDFQLPLELHQD